MFMYFVLFTVVGLIVGLVLPKNVAAICYVLVAVVWATMYGPFWAIISLVEMGLGYALAIGIKAKN